ncbi:hypothetical protein PHLGIDRAFT_223989 [Phlebiopsis gigantea 11061_1 CR5-6]|uniref:RanBD1 domain-containing protein n=1 Tax=Phlebiopsis gigantea (strain 11061_1 CR5-6) TaxID=745531 RepID=A0A0C3RT83_PHLG1|nr:hypothetical protein PHLGIDRAFT_223989 [Phlebiopsis gigantea 11061_1 CR5-6]
MDTTPLVTEREASDSSSLDYPTPQSIGDVTEPGSLKRKHRDDATRDTNRNSSDDVGEADVSLASLNEPPRKRCRTPSENIEQPERTAPSSGSEDPPVSSVDLTSSMTRDSGELTAQDSEASVPIAFPESATATVQSSQTAQTGLSFSIPACKPSSAFAAFAGASSAFSTTAQIGAQKPAWCSAAPSIAGSSSDGFKPKPTPPAEPCIEPADAEPSSEVQTTSAAGETWTPAASVSLSTETPEANPLVALTFAKSTHVGTTGEEDEDTTSELRGVKLFIKRGTGDFSTGMTGHVKLLSHRTDGGERVGKCASRFVNHVPSHRRQCFDGSRCGRSRCVSGWGRPCDVRLTRTRACCGSR